MIELNEIKEPDDSVFYIQIKPSYIDILAKFMGNCAGENDPDKYRLAFLYDMHKEVYNEYRISFGFIKATKMANIRVINAVLLGECEQIDLAN